MSTSRTPITILPPSEQYGDDVLYGPRLEATQWRDLMKQNNTSDCVIYSHGTFANQQQPWNIRNLQGLDSRIKNLLQDNNITHALPIQRYCWPHLNSRLFPFVCVSPEGTGKTLCHILFIVSACIKAVPLSQLEDLIDSSDNLSTFKLSDLQNQALIVPSCNSKPVNLINPDENLDDVDLNKLCGGEETSSEPNNLASDSNVDTAASKINFEDLYITRHPSYIIVSSNQRIIENIEQQIDLLKEAAYGPRVTFSARQHLAPIARTISVHDDEDTLTAHLNDADILISTPAALMRCFDYSLVDFAKCKMLIFDDLDVTLQLHNQGVREIMKHYMIQREILQSDETQGKDTKECVVYMFARKWTELVKQFVSSIFLQKTIIFGSIAESSVYASVRYDLQFCQDEESKLLRLIEYFKYVKKSEKLVIVCSSGKDAENISLKLSNAYNTVKFLPEDSALLILKGKVVSGSKPQPTQTNFYALSDAALEFVIDDLNDASHLIHYDFPDNMITFDQRFRLMYKHIRDAEKIVSTTIIMHPTIRSQQAKELYDIVSRSSSTLKSTKLELRDFISSSSTTICWRWATTGVCRLEKLSQEDRFGSYCANRHSLSDKKDLEDEMDYPTSGQIRLTITHLVSPNEFYFWFEAHRDINSHERHWTKINRGCEYMKSLQAKLDKHKNAQTCSVPLKDLKKGTVYAIYQPELARVDRIVILDNLNLDGKEVDQVKKQRGMTSNLARLQYHSQYSKQCEVFKIDYGHIISVYLRNIFSIPTELTSIPPMCHRGLLLGLKPAHGEPHWPYKSKKCFYDQITGNNLHSVTAWLRLKSDNCFWFEKMIVSRKTDNLDDKRFMYSDPVRELLINKYADSCTSEPKCLPESNSARTLSKWQTDDIRLKTQYAFLRTDKTFQKVFVLHIHPDLSLVVRQAVYNKKVIELESFLIQDYNDGKLELLSYAAIGVYCLVRIFEHEDLETKKTIYAINRCKIVDIITDSHIENSKEVTVKLYKVLCLDHGDHVYIHADSLYLAPSRYISVLPFQAIVCTLAELNLTSFELSQVEDVKSDIREKLYDYSRDAKDELETMLCKLGTKDSIYLYLKCKDQEDTYMPLVKCIEDDLDYDAFTNKDPDSRRPITYKGECETDSIRNDIINIFISELLVDMIKSELRIAGVDVNDDDKNV